jgi:hypothetical protein
MVTGITGWQSNLPTRFRNITRRMVITIQSIGYITSVAPSLVEDLDLRIKHERKEKPTYNS